MLSLCCSLGRKAQLQLSCCRCSLPSQPFVPLWLIPSSRLPPTTISLIVKPKRIAFNIYNYNSHCFNTRRLLLLTFPRHTGIFHGCIQTSVLSTLEKAPSCSFWFWILIKMLELKKISLWKGLFRLLMLFDLVNYETLNRDMEGLKFIYQIKISEWT